MTAERGAPRRAPATDRHQRTTQHAEPARIAPDLAARWTDALGGALPARANTVAVTDDGWLAWLRPDEWLAVSAATDPDSGVGWLRSAAADAPVSVVDVSATRVTLRISGSGARQLLAHGCRARPSSTRVCGWTMRAEPLAQAMPPGVLDRAAGRPVGGGRRYARCWCARRSRGISPPGCWMRQVR